MRNMAKASIALIKDCCTHAEPVTCKKDNQRKSDLYKDPLGYYWCREHEYRGHLLLWANQHSWPAIAYYGQMRYAIGDDKCKPDDRRSLWEKAVLLGSDDMILSAYRHVYGEVEEV